MHNIEAIKQELNEKASLLNHWLLQDEDKDKRIDEFLEKFQRLLIEVEMRIISGELHKYVTQETMEHIYTIIGVPNRRDEFAEQRTFKDITNLELAKEFFIYARLFSYHLKISHITIALGLFCPLILKEAVEENQTEEIVKAE